MTPEQLDAIQARLEAASIHDGPWAVEEDESWGAKVYVREPGFGTMYICENLNQQEDGLADAEFIANAPDDIAALLAYARDLEAQLADLETKENTLPGFEPQPCPDCGLAFPHHSDECINA